MGAAGLTTAAGSCAAILPAAGRKKPKALKRRRFPPIFSTAAGIPAAVQEERADLQAATARETTGAEAIPPTAVKAIPPTAAQVIPPTAGTDIPPTGIPMRNPAMTPTRILMRTLLKIPTRRTLMKETMAAGTILTRRRRTGRQYLDAGYVSGPRDAGRGSRNFALSM
jgi:hypothetical protein